jgi:hypothetical protein
MAQTLKAGQYYGETQYTDLFDPAGPGGPCAGIITVGSVTPSQTTLTVGLSGVLTRLVAVPSSAGTGVTNTPCTGETLPAAGAFSAGTLAGTYVAPTSGTIVCNVGTSPLNYTLTSGNTGTINGKPVTDTVTILPASIAVPNVGGIALTSAFKETTVYSQLVVNTPTPVTCYVSTDSIYIRSGT